jgi:hypothetical protein
MAGLLITLARHHGRWLTSVTTPKSLSGMSRRRQLGSSEERGKPTQQDSRALSHTNRKGDTYYLHEGRTKTGKVRYFVAKTIGVGSLSAMPSGFEFTESINAVVSVRKIDTSAPMIPDIDLAIARAELARHPHLRLHRVEAVKGEILVYEPVGGMSLDLIDELSRSLGRSPGFLEGRLGDLRSRTRFDPVMKFVPSGKPGQYDVHRMTYRGEGGWSWPLASGPLQKLVKKYLGKVGTEELFELL